MSWRQEGQEKKDRALLEAQKNEIDGVPKVKARPRKKYPCKRNKGEHVFNNLVEEAPGIFGWIFTKGRCSVCKKKYLKIR